jgi:biopolymer transport protein ExbD
MQAHSFSRGNAQEEQEGQIVAEINITPLTDIFLVLLIIFMVTSSAMAPSAVSIDLPQASKKTAGVMQEKAVVVTLLAEQKVKINDQELALGSWSVFEKKLKAAFAQTPSRMVVLAGDKKSFLGNVIELMDHARKAGAEQFSIATLDTQDL